MGNTPLMQPEAIKPQWGYLQVECKMSAVAEHNLHEKDFQFGGTCVRVPTTLV